MTVPETSAILGSEDALLGYITLGAIPPLPTIGWVEATGGTTSTVEEEG